MRTPLLILGLSVHLAVTAQPAQEPNLVPNPGFETLDSLPIDWFYSGKDFNRVMQYWESPTGASPDVYGAKIYVPRHWREKGFGQSKPHRGESMVGITLYGCQGGKPHCREYLQIELYEPLVPDQRYEISFWTSHLPRSLQVDHLDVAFAPEPVRLITDDRLTLIPPEPNRTVLSTQPGQWLQYKVEFHAADDDGYLVIGNFYSDAETRVVRKCSGDCLPFAYYYIDDVSLKKLPPILPIPVAEDALSQATLEEGKVIRLNYIFFDSGKADFLPRSFRELNTLLRILQEHPDMVIQVRGHTDNLGTEEYNLDLSMRRAKNVVAFLTTHGIEGDRLSYQGLASHEPIADNEYEEGRKRNRRVEFLIMKMHGGE